LTGTEELWRKMTFAFRGYGNAAPHVSAATAPLVIFEELLGMFKFFRFSLNTM
jgi:hypothetical protein